MKVETNLKSGALLQDASRTAASAANEVGSYFNKASLQAKGLTTTVTGKVASTWNCLKA